MAEYIERGALMQFPIRRDHYDGKNGNEHFINGIETVLEYAENLPAADVAPVVHSYWEEYSCSQYMGTDEVGDPKWRDGRFYVCHNYKCRRKTVIKSNYCPNCGGKMEGGAANASD